MSNATTASSAHEEINVDTGVADATKAVRRSASRSQERGNDREQGESRSEWLDRSKSVQRRIASYGRNLTADLTRQFNQTRADDEARWQRQFDDQKAELEKIKRDQTSGSTDVAHEAEMSALQSALEAALEGGDSKKAAQLQTTIARKEAAHIQAKTVALTGKSGAEARAEKLAEKKADPVAQGSSKAAAYIKATDWWDDPEFAAEKGAANEYHRVLIERGSDPESDAHYRRINKLLRKKFPELKLTDPDNIFTDEFGDLGLDDDDDDDRLAIDKGDELEANAKRKRGATQNFHDRGNGAESTRSVKLNDGDIETMLSMKLDPKNDQHVLVFAQEKRERMAREGA